MPSAAIDAKEGTETCSSASPHYPGWQGRVHIDGRMICCMHLHPTREKALRCAKELRFIHGFTAHKAGS